MKRPFFSIFFIFLFFGLLFCPQLTQASASEGTILEGFNYVWSETAGWLDFGLTQGEVKLSDTILSGYVYGENIGWISLHCSNTDSCALVPYGVSNNGEGRLTGYAYGANVGWIDFSPPEGGVFVSSEGEFSGSAWGENIGWLIFNCSETSSCDDFDYKLKTDWRPLSVRLASAPVINASRGSSGFMSLPVFSATSSPLSALAQRTKDILLKTASDLIPKPLKKIFKQESIEPFLSETLPQETPLALKGLWSLVPSEGSRFVFAPLPSNLTVLAEKIPTLNETFKKVGIKRMTDLGRLISADFTLPTLASLLSDVAGLPQDGRLPTSRLPIAELSDLEKESLPSDLVFVRAGGEKIDLNVNLTFNEQGEAKQKINALSGQTLNLALRPEEPVKAIKGYFVLSPDNSPEVAIVPVRALASVALAMPKLSYKQEEKIDSQTKFVLAEFDYQDEDGDGIYTAQFDIPPVSGRYKIITVMDYLDPSRPPKEIKLVTVIDPEGYVFTKRGNLEANVAGAEVSLYWQNPQTGEFELWPAKDYLQKNPQITGSHGSYSFLVPEGEYYLRATASGYKDFTGNAFTVLEGDGIHFNIELNPTAWLWLDWKFALLFIFALMVAYLSWRLYRLGVLFK